MQRHDVVGDDAGVGPAELMQFAHDAGDAAGEHECQGHLGHDQPIAHAAVARRHGGAASGLLRDAADVGARRDHRRQQPDRDGHRDAGTEEECEGAPVEGDLVRPRNSCGAGGDQDADAPPRDRGADHPRRQRQHQALAQELTHQPARAGAERGSRHDLLGPRHGARQQQVGDVGAGSAEHQADGDEQQPERALDDPEDLALQRRHLHPDRPVPPRRRHVEPLFERVELGVGRRRGHARTEPGDDGPARRRRLAHHPQVGARLWQRTAEAGRGAVWKLEGIAHDADDRQLAAMQNRSLQLRIPARPGQRNRPPDDGRVTIEKPGPEVGADHRHRRRVGAGKDPAGDGRRPEHGEELRVRRNAGHPLGALRRFEQPRRQLVTAQPRERGTLLAKRLEVRAIDAARIAVLRDR